MDRTNGMYHELDAADRKPTPDEPAPKAPCQCACGEPAPADGDTPAGSRANVYLEVQWDIGGG